MTDPSAPRAVTEEEVRAAADRIAGQVLRTPTIPCEPVSRALGAEVFLKLENLQPIGSFKERGAANRIALLSPSQRRAGVIAMSAGNHAQGVARHAHLRGIHATIVMPRHTPAAKVTRTAAWGAEIVLHGDTLAEAGAHAHALEAASGKIFVHPYDDPAVIAGQGTMALEILDDVPGLDALVVPVGGGGMAAGCAAVGAGTSPAVPVIAVQVASHASLAQMRAGQPVRTGGATIAEGIAVQSVGAWPLATLALHVREVLTVSEQSVERAICLLAEEAKIVAEGAGAVGVAALLEHPARFAGRRVAIPICGGNIDARILANVLQRGLLRDGRLLRLRLDIPDRPGVLADIATLIGQAGGNIIEVQHQRLFSAPSVQAAELELMIEARDAIHAAALRTALFERYTGVKL